MLYRKSSPTPPRLLLRIVATAGAGTLLGIAACSSSSGTPVMGPEGSVPAVNSDASDTDAETIVTGIAPNPDASLACGNGGVCGVAPYFPDAGDAGATSDGGISDAALADAADDGAAGPCHPCGVVVRPDE